MNPMGPVYAMRVSVGLIAGALLAVGCTSNPYFIGASCTACGGSNGSAGNGGSGGAVDQSLTFAVDLSETGSSRLDDHLAVPGGSIPASLILRGESATASDWPSDQGARLLKAQATPQVGLDAPFTDATRALGFSSTVPTYRAQSTDLGAVASDDFALELVLRATPGATLLDKRGAGRGWSVEVSPAGALQLVLRDDQRLLQITSEPLAARAWYHCLFWVSRSAGGRADCNGRSGTPTDLSPLGDLSGSAPLTLGGGAPSNEEVSQLAYAALFRTPAGGEGDASNWGNISRQRFAKLTGVSPRVAHGNPLPQPGLRESIAYLDLQRAGSAARRLFIVGPDWPRIACRNDAEGARECGYLGEAKRARWLDPEASAWTASALSVSPKYAAFVDGEVRMSALIPSSAAAPHTLTWSGTYAGTRQALSFFARAEAGQFVGVNVGTLGRAIFDVRAGSLVSAPGAVRATIEDWGDGVFRCSYVFTPELGALSYQLELFSSADGQPALGDSTSAFLDLAQLQLDVGQAAPGSPLAAEGQAADQLSFVGDDGNLPASGGVSQRLTVLLPAGPRLTDQAVLNLNRGGTFGTQVQLFITGDSGKGDSGKLRFWGISNRVTHWTFDHPMSLVDGLRHSVRADWTTELAELSVDGASLQQAALPNNDPPFSLDRIDVSFSTESSGSLEGLVGGLQLGARATP